MRKNTITAILYSLGSDTVIPTAGFIKSKKRAETKETIKTVIIRCFMAREEFTFSVGIKRICFVLPVFVIYSWCFSQFAPLPPFSYTGQRNDSKLL